MTSSMVGPVSEETKCSTNSSSLSLPVVLCVHCTVCGVCERCHDDLVTAGMILNLTLVSAILYIFS